MARVLIVDDDRQFRRVVKLALTVRGHEVKEAANGLEAMERLKGFTPDLVLLDWQMSGTDGEETCQAIRAISEVPIIVLSALDRSKEARAYGLNASLTKPSISKLCLRVSVSPW